MEELKYKKSELRKHLISQRDLLSQDEVRISEIQLAANFLKNKKLIELIKKSKQPIAIYYPSKNELSPITLAKYFAKKYGTKFCLPIVTKKNSELKFLEWNLNENELHPSKIYKNILEPKTTKTKSVYIIPDTLIIPLSGFDENCNRLGMGGGFYDRTIINLRMQNQKITTIGIGYEIQKLDKIPAEENDQVLDFVVTENKIWIYN